jgi:hypothetical protein
MSSTTSTNSTPELPNAPVYNSNVQLEVRNRVLNKQMNQINKNENLLEKADIDLNTLRRQAEIVNDSALRKANNLFILRTVMTFLGLAFIPLILKSQDIISGDNTLKILGVLTIIALVVLLFNFKSVIIRTSNRFNVRNFDQPNADLPIKKVNKLRSKCKPKIKKSDGLVEFEKRQNILKAIESRYKFIPKKNNRINTQINNLEQIEKQLIDEYKKLDPDISDDVIRNQVRALLRKRFNATNGVSPG